MEITLEIGKKKVCAMANDYPGWCRSAKTEEGAIESLLAYAPRYAKAVPSLTLPDLANYTVSERLEGNASTDFGGPGVISIADERPVSEAELARLAPILKDCWNAFEQALAAAQGRELRKGPRGGGRDQTKMLAHVIEAETAYLRRIAYRFKGEKEESLQDQMVRIRIEGAEALRSAVIDGLPAAGPRGGKIWTPRTYVIRAAWHLLDHVWEIEDRLI